MAAAFLGHSSGGALTISLLGPIVKIDFERETDDSSCTFIIEVTKTVHFQDHLETRMDCFLNVHTGWRLNSLRRLLMLFSKFFQELLIIAMIVRHCYTHQFMFSGREISYEIAFCL